jgi:hypothetical protein
VIQIGSGDAFHDEGGCVRQVEVEAAQQEDEVAAIRHTRRSFVADGFEEHAVECIQEAGRLHAGMAADTGQPKPVMCDVVGSAGGGAVAVVVIVEPGFEQSDQGRRQVKFGDAR